MTLTIEEITALLKQSKRLIRSQSQIPQDLQDEILTSVVDYACSSDVDSEVYFLGVYRDSGGYKMATSFNWDVFCFELYWNADALWCANEPMGGVEPTPLATVRGDLAKELIDRLKPLCLKWAFGDT